MRSPPPADITVIPDALADPRFATNPFVTNDPFVRFYAGAPLVTAEGAAIGTVCVLDHIPRDLTGDQRAALAALARQVVAHLDLRRTTAALRASESRFRLFMDHSPALAFLKDTEGRYQYANQTLLRRIDREAAALVGQDDTALWPAEVAAALQAADKQVMQTGQTVSLEEVVLSPDDQPRTWQVYKFAVPMGEERWVGGMALDITVQKQYARYLEAMHEQLEGKVQDLTIASYTDGLSGLANRRAFDKALAAQTQQAVSTGQPLAIVLLDIDHFKSYNDAYGHPAGDGVLRQVAQFLAASARGADLVARYGGEEFVLLLPNTTAAQAQIVAERCRAAIAGARWPGRAVTISAGVAAAENGALDPVTLLATADQALYRAKHLGRDQVVVASRDERG